MTSADVDWLMTEVQWCRCAGTRMCLRIYAHEGSRGCNVVDTRRFNPVPVAGVG